MDHSTDQKAREEDRLLFERLSTDPRAIGDIYDRYAKNVYAFCFKRCGQKEIAEDLTSQTFIRLLESAGTLEFKGTRISSWLFRVASNALIDHYRTASTKRESSVDGQVSAWEPPSDDDPAWNTELAIDGARLRKALMELPERDQQVLDLRFFAGLEPQEIAAELGISSNHASVLVYRAVGRLREVMLTQ
jgi:RNA polymerase sigma factor (sigma-70 family)